MASLAFVMLAVAGCGSSTGGGMPFVRTGNAIGYVDIDKVVQANPLAGQLQTLQDQIEVLNERPKTAATM